MSGKPEQPHVKVRRWATWHGGHTTLLEVDGYFHVIDADETKVLSQSVTPDYGEALAIWHGYVETLLKGGVDLDRWGTRTGCASRLLP